MRLAAVGTGLVLALALLGAGASVALGAADAAPMFTADTPPAFQLDVVYGSGNSCGSGCSYNNQIGYAFAATGNPAPTYSVSSGALPTGTYLDPINGLLYGVPSSSGQSYSFSVSASNGVAPDAVAGPFTGTVSTSQCASVATGSSGDTTTFSTSTTLVTANAVDVALPDASAVATEVVGRVIRNGVATVVYDRQAPAVVSDPGAQALLAAAARADTSAAPGSSVGAPALMSTMTRTSAPSLVARIVPGPASTQESAVTTSYIGPATINIGPLQSCTFMVASGAEDIDTLVSYPQASATDEEQSTDTTTSVYDVDATVPAAPVNTSLPVISGTAKAGKKLSCSHGSWTRDPTLFGYQWRFDGTPIQDAMSDAYTVQKSDEGLALTCTVTAFNAGGAGTPATSHGVSVPVPHVARCPGATGAVNGGTLGLLRLGMTRAQARHAYTHSSNRGKRYEDFFCLTPIGVRDGYASPKLLSSLPKAKRKRLTDRVIWGSTSSAHYAIHGVRPGATISAAAQQLKLTGPIHVGLNDWYLAPNGASTAVLKVRRGIVEEIGIGDRSLTTGHRAQVVFLNSFT